MKYESLASAQDASKAPISSKGSFLQLLALYSPQYISDAAILIEIQFIKILRIA